MSSSSEILEKLFNVKHVHLPFIDSGLIKGGSSNENSIFV